MNEDTKQPGADTRSSAAVRYATAKVEAAIDYAIADWEGCLTESLSVLEGVSLHQSGGPDLQRIALVILKDEVERLRSELDFYKFRCDSLIAAKARLREPELTIVCDIMANGKLLPDLSGERYGASRNVKVSDGGDK